jgi:GR25 family glycosyltransferase involved in LPS biosynthesis
MPQPIQPIPTFVINLQSRTDRKASVLEEFDSRSEFSLEIVDAIYWDPGSTGLWKTIKQIISIAKEIGHEFILICEDDHTFTENYSHEILLKCLNSPYNPDVLVGGVSSVQSIFPVSDNLIWIEKFSGAQFLIVYKRFYDTILNAIFQSYDQADHKISGLSDRIYLIYPFISTQKDFGYSDITSLNNKPGRVPELFINTDSAIRYILERQGYYQFPARSYPDIDTDGFVMPVYIINLAERQDRLAHIMQQFSGRDEFEVHFFEAVREKIGAVGLWKSIREIVKIAQNQDDDVIIICEDDHEFSGDYSKETLFRNIIEAHYQGADVLSGGTSGGFGHALQVGNFRFWVNHFLSTQFIVLFRKFFSKILEAEFDESVTADNFISELTSNKMVMFPFISTQKDFGYSDITAEHVASPEIVPKMFLQSAKRLSKIQSAVMRHL